MKLIGWFSGGVTSAVAIHEVIRKTNHEVIPIYFETGQHHPDHDRFLKDCERWYEMPIQVRRSHKYKDLYDVLRKTRYINGPFGARCTKELKIKVRQKIEKEIEWEGQIFGFEYAKSEINRAARFLEQHHRKAYFPLIELKINKVEALDMLKRNNIEIPEMYKLGYNNSNCIGCVKGGKGYWNRIRITHPEIFAEMSKIEREVGNSCIREVFLDELDPNSGRYKPIESFDCGAVCQLELLGLPEIHGTETFPKLFRGKDD